MCNGCKSPDTILTKENRLFFLRCEQASDLEFCSFPRDLTSIRVTVNSVLLTNRITLVSNVWSAMFHDYSVLTL